MIGECALASPIFDSSGMLGAIEIVVPAADRPVDPASRDAVREIARAISRELGAASWLPLN